MTPSLTSRNFGLLRRVEDTLKFYLSCVVFPGWPIMAAAMTSDTTVKSNQDFVILLGRIVSLYGFIYAVLFSLTGAIGTAFVLVGLTFFFYPLMLQMFKLNRPTLAKYSLMFQGLTYISSVLITIKPDIQIEYYLIPQLLAPLLVFNGRQIKEFSVGAILPLLLWLAFVNNLLPSIPSLSYNLNSYSIIFVRLNFLGSFFISAIFLNFYRIYILRLSEAVKSELEKFKNLSQHLNNSQRIAKTGSWQYNFKSDELIWSDEVYRIFEVTRESFHPTMELFDEFVHHEDFPSVTKTFRDAIKNRGPYEIVHRIVLNDERIKYLREQCEFIYDQDGNPEVAMGTTQDITETKFNDEYLNNSAKMAAVGEMAGSIAHEINNPLTVIAGRANSLMRKVDRLNLTDATQRDEIKNDINRIVKHVERVSRIVRSLGSISRNDATDPMQVVPVQKIFDDIRDLSSECFRSKSVELSFETSPDAKILCHPSEMSQVVLNLVNNAFDAVTNLEEKWVHVKTVRENNCQKIVIIDSGKGIPKPISQKLMHPFFTTKPIGKGTGLGLPICKRIVEKHNGRIFYDEKNINTSFVIELPINDSTL